MLPLWNWTLLAVTSARVAFLWGQRSRVFWPTPHQFKVKHCRSLRDGSSHRLTVNFKSHIEPSIVGSVAGMRQFLPFLGKEFGNRLAPQCLDGYPARHPEEKQKPAAIIDKKEDACAPAGSSDWRRGFLPKFLAKMPAVNASGMSSAYPPSRSAHATVGNERSRCEAEPRKP